MRHMIQDLLGGWEQLEYILKIDLSIPHRKFWFLLHLMLNIEVTKQQLIKRTRFKHFRMKKKILDLLPHQLNLETLLKKLFLNDDKAKNTILNLLFSKAEKKEEKEEKRKRRTTTKLWEFSKKMRKNHRFCERSKRSC